MITYELAKKLKDAGFPLRKGTPGIYWRGGFGYNFEDETIYLFPLLSELIEACGENFYGLFTLWEKGYIKKSWAAVQRQQRTALGIEEKEVNAFGSTPEEAVALLWIAIHKK